MPLPLPFCAVRTQHSVPLRPLQAQGSSIGSKRKLLIGSQVQNEGNGWAGSGAGSWRLDNNTESYVFLANMGEKPARVGFKVWASGETYYLDRLQLAPHETRMIDLRKLRDAQEPDFRKHVIPAGASEGSVLWSRIDNVPVMGRLAVVRRDGTSFSPDCSVCGCPDYYSVTTIVPATACPIPVGATDQETAEAWFISPCTGDEYWSNFTDASAWSSDDISVLTLSSTGLLTALSGGTADAISQGPQECTSYYMSDAHCLCNSLVAADGRGPCPVWQPTHAVLTESGSWSSTTCSGTGVYRTYSAYDNFYHLITTSDLAWTLHENVTSSSNCNMKTDGTETEETFTDYIANCDAGCTFTSTQWLSILYNSYTWTLKAQDCVDSTFNTCKLHTGWKVTATTTKPYVTVADY